MNRVKTELWSKVLDRIRSKVDPNRFNLWFHNIEPISLTARRVELGVPNLFVRDWLQEHFLDVLEGAFAEELSERPTVRFVITSELFKKSRKVELAEGFSQIKEAVSDSISEGYAKDKHNGVRPDLVLENFIVGACNRLAHCCALQVVQSEQSMFNPLFFHSVSGLGKTHLLQGIWHGIKKRSKNAKVVYITAEVFTNQFVYAMRHSRLDAFRHKYRNVDVLLLDDVHFFSNKLGLQEEFLHTYDALDRSKAQVVLASDVHPKMLSRLRESLANRFASGMIVKLGGPDFETRTAILKSKAVRQGKQIRRDVLEYIAHNFEGSVRELEGAITCVLAYAALAKTPLNVKLAEAALRRLLELPRKRVRLEDIERATGRHFGVSRADLRSGRRSRAISFPRQICMYLSRTMTDHSCLEIANYFGSGHHSTAIFAERKTRERMKEDGNLAELVSALKESIVKQP